MSIIDDLENAFQVNRCCLFSLYIYILEIRYNYKSLFIKACMAPFTNQPSSHVFDNDELKANMDNILRFLEISRQVESSFISKRAILASQKPELILEEEINDLKSEINKKEVLLTKYYEKLNKWISIVNDASSGKPINTSLISGPMMQMPLRMNQMKGPLLHGPNPMMQNQIRSQNSLMLPNSINPQMPMANASHQMQFNPVSNQSSSNHGGLQGPLAYLELTTSNIGLNNR